MTTTMATTAAAITTNKQTNNAHTKINAGGCRNEDKLLISAIAWSVSVVVAVAVPVAGCALVERLAFTFTPPGCSYACLAADANGQSERRPLQQLLFGRQSCHCCRLLFFLSSSVFSFFWPFGRFAKPLARALTEVKGASTIDILPLGV